MERSPECRPLQKSFSYSLGSPDLTRPAHFLTSRAQFAASQPTNATHFSTRPGQGVLSAAAEMKRLAGQINVTIHALGIILCLPHILEPGEVVESVSLGADNTGRHFDPEMNYRVAEFKFIRWRGGAELIRQNGIFKDYLLLADYETSKRKYLYLLGLEHALKFFRGGRAISIILSRDNRLRTVREYFAVHGGDVMIEDVCPWLSELSDLISEPISDEAEI
jgi:hypothetical protein